MNKCILLLVVLLLIFSFAVTGCNPSSGGDDKELPPNPPPFPGTDGGEVLGNSDSSATSDP